MLIKGLNYADGDWNQFHGYQIADLEGQVYYQAKEKHIHVRQKMKSGPICHLEEVR